MAGTEAGSREGQGQGGCGRVSGVAWVEIAAALKGFHSLIWATYPEDYRKRRGRRIVFLQ